MLKAAATISYLYVLSCNWTINFILSRYQVDMRTFTVFRFNNMLTDWSAATGQGKKLCVVQTSIVQMQC